MATYLTPSPHIYDPHHSASQAYFDSYPDAYACQFPQDSHYYPYSGGPSTAPYAVPHAMNDTSVGDEEVSPSAPVI